MGMSGIDEFTSEFFDASSKAWRANKVPIGEGSFRYKRNAFPPEKPAQTMAKKVEKEPMKPRLRRSARLQVRLRFMREVANLKK